jgi:hypothetical protein
MLTDHSLFNNPLLSDVMIYQIANGVTKKYHAHKVVLCMGSKWFAKTLTGECKLDTSQGI